MGGKAKKRYTGDRAYLNDIKPIRAISDREADLAIKRTAATQAGRGIARKQPKKTVDGMKRVKSVMAGATQKKPVPRKKPVATPKKRMTTIKDIRKSAQSRRKTLESIR